MAAAITARATTTTTIPATWSAIRTTGTIATTTGTTITGTTIGTIIGTTTTIGTITGIDEAGDWLISPLEGGDVAEGDRGVAA
ncbi:MAG: hypothetical protein E5Y01_31535 [Mesorhizobium sp.]|nr:MAG: hypothetical protein EOR75_18785 [Mesorhizobium sp.]TJV47707.1 MAG: hypothetical protein E5Y01_31535 [Mesorhizobium sp.]